MTTIAPIAHARALTKSYGTKQVLKGLDFAIPAGHVYGLVGHNGARPRC